jgi:hypothetical protein
VERARRRLAAALTGIALTAAAVGGTFWLTRERPALDALAEVRRVVPEGMLIEVEVLNGTTRTGLARLGTRVLRRAGFDVVLYDTAPEQVDTTVVIIRRGGEHPARLLVEALGTGRIEERHDPLRLVDLTVILGPDWRPPPGLMP